MATKTIKSAGGDYSSLSGWESGQQANITGLGPEIAQCYSMADTGGVDINGWTTTATDYIQIIGTGSGVHNGTARDVSGSGYCISSPAGTPTIKINEEYVRFDSICIKQDSDQNCLLPQTVGASNDLRLDNCIIHRTANTVTNIYTAANVKWTITNCVIYGTGWAVDSRTGTSCTMRNCTAYTTHTYCYVTLTTDSIKNCYGAGGSTNDFWNGGSTTGDHNCSSDTSATTQFSSSYASKAASSQFVNASTGASADFHLKAGAFLIGVGTPISGVTTDYEGSTRNPSTPDIGADEFTSYSAGVSTGKTSTILYFGCC